MASKHNSLSAWTEELSWRRLDLLDMIFLGWVAAAFIVVAAVNLYIRFFHHPKPRTKQSLGETTSNGKSWQQWQNGTITSEHGHGRSESCSWINDAALWLYSRGNYSTDLEDRILRSLNNRALQYAHQDYSIKFEHLQYDKNAFKFLQIATANINEDNFNILASVECCKVVFKVSTSNQSDHGFQQTDSFEIELTRLRGTLKVACQSSSEGVTATLCFASSPEIQLQLLAATSQSEVDKRMLETAVRECIGSLQTTIVVSAYGGQGQQMMVHDDRFSTSSVDNTPVIQQVAASSERRMQHVTVAVVSDRAITENLALVDSRSATPTPDNQLVASSTASYLRSEPSYDEFSYQDPNAVVRESVFDASTGYHYWESSRDVHHYDNSSSLTATGTGGKLDSEYADIDSIRERKNKKSTLAATAAVTSPREPPPESFEVKRLSAFKSHHPASVPAVPPAPMSSGNRQVEHVVSISSETGEVDSRRSSQALSDSSTLCSSVNSTLVDLSNANAPISLPPVPDPVSGSTYSDSGLLMELPGASGNVKRSKSLSGKQRKSSSSSKASTLSAKATAGGAIATEGSGSNSNTRPLSAASGRIPIEIREMTLLSQPNDFEMHYRQNTVVPMLDRRQTVARSTSSPTAMPSQRSRDKTLLVKVIKANGLGDKNITVVHPYCVISLDQPPQKHVTAVIRNTVNPFWDEHFLLTVDDSSRQIRFEVYHNDRSGSEELLGRAVVTVAEIRRNSGSRQVNSSSRQIVPLTGRSGSKSTSGSITIECLYLDQTDGSPLVSMPLEASVRRPSDSISRSNAFETSMGSPTPRPSSVASNQLSAHEGALAPLQGGSTQHSPQVRGGLVSPTVTVSSPDHSAGVGRHGGADEISIPVIRTPDNRSSAERDRYSTSTATSTGSVHDGKKQKTSLADALRKRFGRPKKRAQSADRFSQSMRESSLLRPPEQQVGGGQTLTTGDNTMAVSSERLGRKERSGSFGSSFKKLFGGKKKKDSAAASRENSVGRSASAQPLADTSASSSSQLASYQDVDSNQQQASYSRNTLAYSDPYSRQQYLEPSASYQDQVNGGHFDDGSEHMNSYEDDQQFDDSYRTASSRAGDVSSASKGRQRNSYGEMTGGYAYSTSVPANNAQHLHMY